MSSIAGNFRKLISDFVLFHFRNYLTVVLYIYILKNKVLMKVVQIREQRREEERERERSSKEIV